MPLIAELDARLLQNAVTLHIDQVLVVDQNVGDPRVEQQRLKRSQAEDLIQQLRLNSFLFSRIQGHFFLPHDFEHQVSYRQTCSAVIDRGQFFQIQLGNQRTVNIRLQLLEIQIIHGPCYLS